VRTRHSNCSRSVDGSGPGQPGTAHPAGLALAAIHQQLELKVSRFAGAGAVVPERRSVGCDGGPQDPANLTVQPAVVLRLEAAGRLRWIDAGCEERFVGVDVPDTCEVSLIHDHLLDCLAAAPERSTELLGRESILERLGADRPAVALPPLFVQEEQRT